ncbi:MAG: hypothetical protein RIQ56_634 [Candidatus Parcubacteria bacterium]
MTDHQKPSHSEQYLNSITQNRHWDSEQFRHTLVTLAALPPETNIPSPNRPDSLHLQSLSGYFEELMSETLKDGRERSRAVIAELPEGSRIDPLKGKLLMGPRSVGTEGQVMVDMRLQPGKEGRQRVVADFHTHPITQGLANGFSSQDFFSFLSTPGIKATFIGYGEATRILALKTSVTPQRSADSIAAGLAALKKEIFSADNLRRDSIPVLIAKFNKLVCVEFGLTLYFADSKSRDLYTRVEVTKD